MTEKSTVTACARAAHEANRAYCISIGDNSQPAWVDAPGWQRESAIAGAAGILDGSVRSAEESHVSWSERKVADGWVVGSVKDPVAKTHPCLVPYDDLPSDQKKKDSIFRSVVLAVGE